MQTSAAALGSVGREDSSIPGPAVSCLCLCSCSRQVALSLFAASLTPQAASSSSSDVCHCYPGLAVFAWLSLALYKANEALRKQVALKADYNRLHCISLAGLLTCHVPVVLLCLRSEHLWQRFVLTDPSPVPTVRFSPCPAASCCFIAVLFCFILLAASKHAI